jgi:hypothetical protein
MTVTLRKPAKGSALKARRARRAKINHQEAWAKWAAKERDGWECRRCGEAQWPSFAEAAHINGKGMGGDHGLRSSTPADYVTLCRSCHQGPRSVHSGHVVIECGPARGDGPVTFRERALTKSA